MEHPLFGVWTREPPRIQSGAPIIGQIMEQVKLSLEAFLPDIGDPRFGYDLLPSDDHGVVDLDVVRECTA